MTDSYNDAKHRFYEEATLETGSVNDLMALWLLREVLGSGAESLNVLWIRYMELQGFTEGSLQDRQAAWLESMGYLGPLNDMWTDYYNNPPPVAP